MARGGKQRRNEKVYFTYTGKAESGSILPEKLELLVVHETVSEIPRMLCSKQPFLTRVYLPLGLEVICARAFEYCFLLQKIALPDTLERIEPFAFACCSGLEEVSLWDGIRRIMLGAFYLCESLATIEIPSTIETIEESVFEECKSLSTVVLQKNGRLVEIESRAFAHSGVGAIDIPCTVTSIGDQAFEQCESLGKAKLSEGLKSIGNSAFLECTVLKRMDIPLSVEAIGEKAFSNCEKLETVVFPPWKMSRGKTVKIGHCAFSKCQSLFNVCIPIYSYTCDVQNDCFQECPLLEKHFGFKNTVQAIRYRFENCPVHELCYHASFTSEEEIWEEVDKLDETSLEMVDPLGMTPFHVLMSCATENSTYLLDELLPAYPAYLHGKKDKFGKLDIDYLEYGVLQESVRDMWYDLTLRYWTIERLFQWGKKEWQHDMAIEVDRALPYKNRKHLWRATEAINMYETIESVSLIELWLWRMQILVARKQTFFSRERVYRKNCRNKCGASFIIPMVMEYLGTRKEYSLYYTSEEESEDSEESYYGDEEEYVDFEDFVHYGLQWYLFRHGYGDEW